MSGQLHATVAISPGKQHPVRGWVGPRPGLAAVAKRRSSCLCWE